MPSCWISCCDTRQPRNNRSARCNYSRPETKAEAQGEVRNAPPCASAHVVLFEPLVFNNAGSARHGCGP